MERLVDGIVRIGDWFIRRCPSCHRLAGVGIYPSREDESLCFVARADWVCRRCEDNRRESEDALLKGGEDEM